MPEALENNRKEGENMWQRYELKYRAKNMLRKCYWAAVVVCLLSAVFTAEFSSGGGRSNPSSQKDNYERLLDTTQDAINGEFKLDSVQDQVKTFLTAGLLPLIMGIGVLVAVSAVIVMIFIGAPILVGSKRFFMCNRHEQGRIGMIWYIFQQGYTLKVVGVILIKNMKVMLWSLLFVIPGIIKSYEYRMLPYILAENPGIEMNKAFWLSREMMYANKWNAFVLDLSFILWRILGALTCSLANIFYVNPYVAATNAELYAVLREDLLRRGVTNTYELPGFGA